MAEEVVINVKQQGSGTALADAAAKMDALKARIAELNQLEKTYASKGITGTADLSKERTALQRELGGMEKEQARTGKERAAEERVHLQARRQGEREVTRELREQRAVRASRLRTLGHGVNAFENAAGVGGMGGMASMLTNPYALAAAAIGATVGHVVSAAIEKANDVQRSEATGAISARESARIMGRSSSVQAEQEASGKYRADRDALEVAEGNKGKIVSTEPIRDLLRGAATSMTLGAVKWETSSQRGERLNDLEIARLQGEATRNKALAEEKFSKGQGGAELEMKKALLNYDMKSVRAQQDKITGMKEYDRVFQATGNKDLANSAADDSVRLQQRERAGKLGGLVNARDGAKDVARVASVAAGLMGGDAWSELHSLHQTVKQQAATAVPLKDFSERRRR